MKINIHIISPYESMLPIINDCIPHFPELNIKVSVGDLKNGVEVALNDSQNNTDIIISRGGTAKLIREVVKIPVLDMQVSGYDMMRSLTLASNLNEKTAIVGFSNITTAAKSVVDLMELPLSIYTVQNSTEVAPLLVELKNKGYEQIVGDYITYKTSNAYGLKGFLIQSGKESIMAVLENAKQLFMQLNKQQSLAKIFEQLIMIQQNDLLILNQQNDIIYKHLTSIELDPFLNEQIYILNTVLEIEKNMSIRKYETPTHIIEITGRLLEINEQIYKLFQFKKYNKEPFEVKGVTLHTKTLQEPLIIQSFKMKNVYQQIELLYQNNEPILLIGEIGTGKDFISTYIHQLYEQNKLLISINFETFDINKIDTIPLQHINTIKLQNIEFVQNYDLFNHFLSNCLNRNIHLFILSEKGNGDSSLDVTKFNKILMPSISDRVEDIKPFVQYLLSHNHEKYGTPAVKINLDAMQLLEETSYPQNLNDLKNIVKQISFSEKDYVIHKQSVQNVLDQENLSLKSILFNGTLKEIEKRVIETVLKEENFNQTKTAERLGINRATLWRKLKE